MKTSVLWLSLFLVAGVLLPRSVSAAEYRDEDILPHVTSLTFLDDKIGIRVTTGFFRFFKFPDFVYMRDTSSFLPMTAAQYARLIGDDKGKPLGRPPYVTTDGTPYVPQHCDSYHGTDSEMVVADQPLAVNLGNCVSVSEVETVGDYIWIGTYNDGGHGDYGAEGLVVVSRSSGQIIRRIDTGKLAITGVRYDPITGFVWAITPDQITVVSQSLEIVSRYRFYHDFDPETGEPRVLLASGEKATNPFAVVAHTLGLEKADQKSFYEAANSIPKEVRDNFSLYGYFMGHTGQPFYPTEMNVLVPFMIKAARLGPFRLNTRYIRLCRFDDQRVADFFLKETEERSVAGILLACLKKYGLEKEAEQAKVRELAMRKQREKKDTARRFIALTKAYFIDFRMENTRHTMRTKDALCRLVRRNPEYIDRFVALFMEDGLDIPRDINFFAHCIRQHMDQPGFDRFLPLLIKGVRVGDANMVLYSSCEALTSIPTGQLSGAVMPVLRARATAASSKKQYDSAAINPFIEIYESCANTSRWVLGHKGRIDLLLVELEGHRNSEIQNAAFDTLNEITGVDLRSVDEWKEWWEENRELRLWLDAQGVQ